MKIRVYGANFERCVLCFESWKLRTGYGNVFGNAYFETIFPSYSRKMGSFREFQRFYLFIFLGGICLPNLYKNINEENDMIKKIFSLVKSQNFKSHFVILRQNNFKKFGDDLFLLLSYMKQTFNRFLTCLSNFFLFYS